MSFNFVAPPSPPQIKRQCPKCGSIDTDAHQIPTVVFMDNIQRCCVCYLASLDTAAPRLVLVAGPVSAPAPIEDFPPIEFDK